MKAVIQKVDKLSGTIIIPSSKSQTIRGLIFGLLAKGTSTLINPLASDDTATAIKVCEALGAIIHLRQNQMEIRSAERPSLSRPPGRTGHLPQGGRAKQSQLNTGDSGITTRFILPVLGLRENFNAPIAVDCGQQMRARPIKSLIGALNMLGMDIRYKKKQANCP